MSRAKALAPGLDVVRPVFEQQKDLELVVLVGSRAHGQARSESDWDFAIQWHKDVAWQDMLGRTEQLRLALAKIVGVTPELIDLIDIPAARLAMRAVIAEEGVLIKGDGTLAWSHLLLRTWGDLEDFYWEKRRAA